MSSKTSAGGLFSRFRDKPAPQPPPEARAGFGSTGAGMKVAGNGTEYPARIDDDDVIKLAQAGGDGRHHEPPVWSENAKDAPAIAMIAGTHDMRTSTIGHGLAEELADTHAQVDRTANAAIAAEEAALGSIDQHEDARTRMIAMKAKNDREGLPVPKRGHGRGYYLAQFAIVFGDLTMISIVFQLLGLSDHLILGVLPFTSPLDIAASTAVFALVALAHYAGPHLNSLLHGIELRRLAPREERTKLPGVSWVHLGMTLGLVAFALAIVFGIGVIRADYLGAKHVRVETVPFILIQLGVFAAAVALSYHHSHPYTKEYHQTADEDTAAEQTMEEACEHHASIVGLHRTLLHRSRALLVQAVHHGELSAADASRQIQLYMFELRRHTGEPVKERLFDLDTLPAPVDRGQEELLKVLMGPVALPEIGHLIDVDKVTMRRQECRQALRKLKQEFDNANIDWGGIKRPVTDRSSSNGGTKA